MRYGIHINSLDAIILVFIFIEVYEVTIEKDSGHLGKIINKKSGLSVNVNQQFLWYLASDGNNTNSSQVNIMLLSCVTYCTSCFVCLV